MQAIGLKRLANTVANVTPAHQDILKSHFNTLWERYHNETEYYKKLYQDRKISLATYRKFTLGKLKTVRDELFQTAKLLNV